MIAIIWVFGFMDISYAAALNYSLLVLRFLICIGKLPIPYRGIALGDSPMNCEITVALLEHVGIQEGV